MFNIGPEELLLILLIALIIFGPRRLPEIGRTVGRSLREFRRASEGIRSEIGRHLELDEDDDPDDGFTGVYPIDEPSRPASSGPGDGPTVDDGAEAPRVDVPAGARDTPAANDGDAAGAV